MMVDDFDRNIVQFCLKLKVDHLQKLALDVSSIWNMTDNNYNTASKPNFIVKWIDSVIAIQTGLGRLEKTRYEKNLAVTQF